MSKQIRKIPAPEALAGVTSVGNFSSKSYIADPVLRNLSVRREKSNKKK
ncbi:MAG TPA: hypothetical protein VL576_02645 [Candidatus Paceibacterota bacterium]|jgi:hypothetical protein|nr:hypothetical protein [Candidatus Paceibacterota bacterium]